MSKEAVTKDTAYLSKRAVSVRIPPDVHRALRLIAATDDKNVSTVIKAAMANYIKSQGK